MSLPAQPANASQHQPTISQRLAPLCSYFKAGSKAVAAAAERAKRQLALEKQRREAEEKQRQQREVRLLLSSG